MLKLLDPRVLLGALIWTLLMVAAGHMTGYQKARDAAQLDKAKAVTKALKDQKAEADKVLADERALRSQAAEIHKRYYLENEDAKAATADLISDLQRDVRRLRVPVRPRVCPVPEAGSGPAATGSGEEGYAELTPDAGVFVGSLVDRGDQAIRKHAALVDLYNALAEKCSAPVPRQGD